MRISDWSSDVCSSDLGLGARFLCAVRLAGEFLPRLCACYVRWHGAGLWVSRPASRRAAAHHLVGAVDERRCGLAVRETTELDRESAVTLTAPRNDALYPATGVSIGGCPVWLAA